MMKTIADLEREIQDANSMILMLHAKLLELQSRLANQEERVALLLGPVAVLAARCPALQPDMLSRQDRN
jgi:hypothetical protein